MCRESHVHSGVISGLFDAGVRVTVGSDDPLVFGTSLSREFLALFSVGPETGLVTPGGC